MSAVSTSLRHNEPIQLVCGWRFQPGEFSGILGPPLLRLLPQLLLGLASASSDGPSDILSAGESLQVLKLFEVWYDAILD